MQVPLRVGTKLVSPEEGKFLRYPAEAACCVLSPSNKFPHPPTGLLVSTQNVQPTFIFSSVEDSPTILLANYPMLFK